MQMKKEYVKYFAALLLFGMNGIVASAISLDSVTIVFTRTLIGSLFLTAAWIATRQKIKPLPDKKQLAYLAASGVAMGASWIFLYEAYRQMGISVATLAYYCGPVIVLILSPLLFHEKFTWAKAAGMIAVLIGMCCVNIQALREGKTAWGVFCGCMSALLYAAMVISYKKAGNRAGLFHPTGQLWAAFITVAVYTGIRQGFKIPMAASDWLPVLLLGVIHTGVGCYFYFSSIGRLPVQTVAICGYLEPLSAVLFSALFLRERMTLVQIIGAALILGGAAFGERFKAAPGHAAALKRRA